MKTGIIALGIVAALGSCALVAPVVAAIEHNKECGPEAMAGYHAGLLEARADLTEHSRELKNWVRSDKYGQYKHSIRPVLENLVSLSETMIDRNEAAINKCTGEA